MLAVTRRPSSAVLAAQSETLDERTVARDVDVLKVTQQATALADEQQQTTTRVMIVLVLFQVFSEIFDAGGQHCDLHLGAAGITRMGGVLVDNCLLGIWC